MTAVLIVNPNASRVTPEVTAAVERELAAAGRLETVLTERPGHAAELAAEACAACERIYVLSGDGGFNEAVNGIEGEEIEIGFLPGGRTSVLPRALGLPRDPVEAARALAVSRRVRRISLGRVNGRRFTFSAGVGLDAEVVRSVDRRGRRDGRRAGDVAFAAALAGALARRRGRLRPAMTLLGRSRVAFVLALNGDPYTYAGPLAVHAAPRARFELGLDVLAPAGLGPAGIVAFTAALLRGGRHVARSDVFYQHDADEALIECDGPTPLQADGEDLGDVTDVRLECERGVLSVLVG